MRKQFSILKTVADGRRYLKLLNDPETFAREAGETDPDVVAVLRSHAAMMRILAARRREIAAQARKMLQMYREGEFDPDTQRGLDADTRRGLDAELEDLGADTAREQARMLQGFTRSVETVRIMQETATNLTIRRSRAARQKLAEILARLNVGPTGRLAICRRRDCGRAFYWSPKRRAQQFCPICRRRFTKQQLWYRAKLEGKPVRTRRKPKPKRRR